MISRTWCFAIAATTFASACDVVSRGARGDGMTDDTRAIQLALDDPTCDEVVFPSGGVFPASVLWVNRSDVTVTIKANATLAGLPDAFKQLRPDCTSEDGLGFDWLHWCALMRVEARANFTLRGAGTLAPGGGGGDDPDFYSALHVSATERVRLEGVRVHCTAWWWCAAMHNATRVHVSRVFVDGAAGRDGMDLVNCRDVVIEDSRVEGSDDGLCFKTISDGGLAAHPARDVVVRRTALFSTWCNALQFGSATEVDMTNFSFSDLEITSARKAAIGIVTMDGANISALRFERVTIRGRDVATPLFVKIGHRPHGENDLPTKNFAPGSIADARFVDVRAYDWGNVSDPKPGHAVSYTPTIEGLNATHRVGPGITLGPGFNLTAPGGGDAVDALIDPPLSPGDYQPRYDGVRPAWALFVRHAAGFELAGPDATLTAAESDGRPAVVLDDVADAQIGPGAAVDNDGADPAAVCQIALRNTTGQWPEDNDTAMPRCAWAPDSAAFLTNRRH